MSPSPIFAARLCARVGEQRQRVPTCFVNCNFLFCNSTIKTAMFQEMLSQICSRGSVVRAVRFLSERLLVLIQTARFCPSGTSAPTLFKSSETKPSLSCRHCGLPPRGYYYFPTVYKKWNTRRVDSTSVLLPTSSLFTQSQFKRRCNCNVIGQCFKCKQISIYFYNPGFWQSASVP